MAEQKEEMIFKFRIQAIKHDRGITFEPAIMNQGVPIEFIVTMMHSWIRGIELAYDDDFKKYT